MDFSSFSSDSLSICCSYGSSVYRRMLLSSSGTLVQCCIGEMSRSVSSRRWHRSSCSQNYISTTHHNITLFSSVAAHCHTTTVSELSWMHEFAFLVRKLIKRPVRNIYLHRSLQLCGWCVVELTNKCIINERYIPEHQNKLNIYDLQNYDFFANFFQPKKIVKFVKF